MAVYAGVNMAINVESLKKQILDENCLKVLTHCKEPKTFKEIKTKDQGRKTLQSSQGAEDQ